MWGCLRDPWGRRKDLTAQVLRVPTGGELLASAIHNIQLLAAVIVITGVGVSSEDVLEDLLGGLIPEVPFSHGYVTFVDLLLAKLTSRW
jgi:pSer/pThr/pTyr-binding forkhead associated (FHA) protein